MVVLEVVSLLGGLARCFGPSPDDCGVEDNVKQILDLQSQVFPSTKGTRVLSSRYFPGAALLPLASAIILTDLIYIYMNTHTCSLINVNQTISIYNSYFIIFTQN